MKKLVCLLSVVLLLGCCACSNDSAQKTDTPVQSEAPSRNDDKSTASETYSATKTDLLGTWKLAYYSDDNELYLDYAKNSSDAGAYSFYPDGTAVIRNSDTDEAVYRYVLPEEQSGTVLFYDSDTGEAAPFFFGYGVVENETGRCLIVSKYNSSEKSVLYLILRETF